MTVPAEDSHDFVEGLSTEDSRKQFQDLALARQMLEIERQRAEMAEQEAKELREKACYGKLLSDGLPPLGVGPLDSRLSVSKHKTIDFDLSPEEISLPVFEPLKLNEKASLVWLLPKDWNCETAVRNIVERVLEDCVNAADLRQELLEFHEVLFSSINTEERDRTDLAILKKGIDSGIVGAIEVRKPPNEAQLRHGIEFCMDKAQKLVRYMADLRSNFGVRFVSGILTTCAKWRFFWLEDSNDAMMCNSLEKFKKLCKKSPPGDAVIPEKYKIKKSRVYPYNDNYLVPALFTLLVKWSQVPCDRISGFLHKNRLYQVGQPGSDEYGVSKLPVALYLFCE